MSLKISWAKFPVYLIIFNAIIWLVFVGLYPVAQISMDSQTRWLISSLLLLDALFYFLAAWGISKKIRWIYYLSFVLFAGNAFLSICDQVGWWDISIGILNLLILVLLIVNRKSLKK